MKASKNVKIKILIIPCIAVAFYAVMFGLIYLFYMIRDEQAFGQVKEDTKSSVVLNEKFGEVTDVKYDNFMAWISTKEKNECVKFKVYTKDNIYKVCTIFKQFNDETHAIGFVIDNKVYMEDN